MSEHFVPGTETWVASDSPTSTYSGVFEDDGSTGYFYAYDRRLGGGRILDAVHIYNVEDVPKQESQVEIHWSADGLKAGLMIDGILHAMINFELSTAYCRNNFPPPSGSWAAEARQPWTEDLAALLG